MLTKLPKSFKSPAPSSGFTLIEVLASVAISLVIFSLAGWAAANMLQNKYKTNADSEIRNNLNRATEFIADEVRQAKTIINDETNIETEKLDPALTEYTSPDGQVVLALEHANYGTQQIIYYTTPPRNDWEIGPRVLRRWGPPLDANGNYQEGVVDWVDAPIVDRLAAEVDDKECDGMNRLPADETSVDGFFVCVNGDGNLGRLRLNAQVALTSSTGGEKDKAVYTTDTKSFARTSDLKGSPPSGPGCFGGCPIYPEVPPPYPQDNTRSPQPFLIDPDNTYLIIRKQDGEAEFIATERNRDCAECKIKIGDSPDVHAIPTLEFLKASRAEKVNLEVTWNGVTYNTSDGTNLSQSVEVFDHAPPELLEPYGITLQNNQAVIIFKVGSNTSNPKTYYVILSFK